MVGSTPTRFRHISPFFKSLADRGAAKGSNKRFGFRFLIYGGTDGNRISQSQGANGGTHRNGEFCSCVSSADFWVAYQFPARTQLASHLARRLCVVGT